MLAIKNDKSILRTANFYITYTCNDTCQFCFVKKKLNKNPALNFQQIQENFYYLQNKISITDIILTGGEPTLHPDFFKIMDFFYSQNSLFLVSLNTNSLHFSDNAFFKDIQNFYRRNFPIKRPTLSISASTIHSWPIESIIEQKKLQGIIRSIELLHTSHAEVILVMTITKQNYTFLPLLAETIVNEHKKYISNKRLIIQIRNVYLENLMTAEQKEKTLVNNFLEIKPYILKTISTLQSASNILTRLFNLPFCYFEKEIVIGLLKEFEPMKKELRFHIDAEHQFSKIQEEFYLGDSVNHKHCKGCLLTMACNKIQKEYTQLPGYPLITPW